MMKKSINIKTITITIIMIIVIGLMFFANSFHRYERGFTCDMIMIAIFLLLLPLLFLLLLEFYSVFKEDRYKDGTSFGFLIIPVFGLILILSPIFNEEKPVPVKFVACYEGTQNTSKGYFRIDDTFEIHATGVFGYNKWHTGKWKIIKDTLFLTYFTETHSLLSDTNIIMQNKYIMPISRDSTKIFRNGFYLGDCKGLN